MVVAGPEGAEGGPELEMPLGVERGQKGKLQGSGLKVQGLGGPGDGGVGTREQKCTGFRAEGMGFAWVTGMEASGYASMRGTKTPWSNPRSLSHSTGMF